MKKILAKPLQSKSKPDTALRAGITVDLKMTRGKQLVEHNPFDLIPDPNNPRPGEIINDAWLFSNLKIGREDSLCKYNNETKEYVIPHLDSLHLNNPSEVEESYNFLRDLALSIRREGLIEPIEIFLADKKIDPDYFINNDKEYGYVVLEGHQRRLASMMAGVETITCIELIDESMLAKLKVKHRKIRRQLSENNLRKDLSVSQNCKIVKTLLFGENGFKITSKELSSITGLNLKICQALSKLYKNESNYPPIIFERIQSNKISFKKIRELVSKSSEQIIDYFKDDRNVLDNSDTSSSKRKTKVGNSEKKIASFKVTSTIETNNLIDILYERFPEITTINSSENEFKHLEDILEKIKELSLAKK